MKPANALIIACFCATAHLVTAQVIDDSKNNEFTTYNNGFIYNEETMSQLAHIVDSLHLKFKNCELWKQYYAVSQTWGHYFFLDTLIEFALKDLKQGISFDEFCDKYPIDSQIKNTLILKRHFYDTENNQQLIFETFGPGATLWDPGARVDFENSPELNIDTWKDQWIINHKESYLEAFYILEDFQFPALPPQYGALVQYSDCMIDTTAHVYNTIPDYGEEEYDTPGKILDFMTLVENYPDKPLEPKRAVNHKTGEWTKRYLQYMAEYALWDSIRWEWIDTSLSKTPEFQQYLQAAITEAYYNNNYDEEFEFYVEKYDSPKTALLLKRNRVVLGMCSMDDSPRQHAIEIARLSAETASWEVFLRSHLDVMNDYFMRVSDGSYAWEGRKTFIGELEALGINTPDMLLGIVFRVSNPATNHYYGSVGRIGRALTESQEKSKIEDQMLAIISDNKLDDFNRGLFINLFISYANHLPELERIEKLQALRSVINTMPERLSASVKLKID